MSRLRVKRARGPTAMEPSLSPGQIPLHPPPQLQNENDTNHICEGCGASVSEPGADDGRMDPHEMKWYCARCWEAFEDPLRAAWHELRRGRLALAQQLAEAVLSDSQLSNPTRVRGQALFLIGKVHAAGGHFEETIKTWSASVDADPRTASTRYYLARMWYKTQNMVQSWEVAAELVAGKHRELAGCCGSGAKAIGLFDFEESYVQAAVLHMLMISVLDPQYTSHSPALLALAKQWIELVPSGSITHPDLTRRFDEIVRFAALIIRLFPFSLQIPQPGIKSNSSCVTSISTPVEVVTLGESHILPLAWLETATTETQQLRFVPRLCVGLKGWHFSRLNSAPQEHQAARCAFQSIPLSSVVLVFAGEIDLRVNGQLVHSDSQSKRSRKFRNTSQGVIATARGFVQGLFSWNATVNHTILIAPVRPPPIDSPSVEHRGAVVLWNSVVRLTAAALSASEGESRIGGSIQLLENVYSTLCEDPDGARLVDAQMNALVESARLMTETNGKLPSGSKQLEAQTKLLDSHPSLVLRDEFSLGDGTHLNRRAQSVYADAVTAAISLHTFHVNQ